MIWFSTFHLSIHPLSSSFFSTLKAYRKFYVHKKIPSDNTSSCSVQRSYAFYFSSFIPRAVLFVLLFVAKEKKAAKIANNAHKFHLHFYFLSSPVRHESIMFGVWKLLWFLNIIFPATKKNKIRELSIEHENIFSLLFVAYKNINFILW